MSILANRLLATTTVRQAASRLAATATTPAWHVTWRSLSATSAAAAPLARTASAFVSASAVQPKRSYASSLAPTEQFRTLLGVDVAGSNSQVPQSNAQQLLDKLPPVTQEVESLNALLAQLGAKLKRIGHTSGVLATGPVLTQWPTGLVTLMRDAVRWASASARPALVQDVTAALGLLPARSCLRESDSESCYFPFVIDVEALAAVEGASAGSAPALVQLPGGLLRALLGSGDSTDPFVVLTPHDGSVHCDSGPSAPSREAQFLERFVTRVSYAAPGHSPSAVKQLASRLGELSNLHYITLRDDFLNNRPVFVAGLGPGGNIVGVMAEEVCT
ncbi:hypothetical protein CAOG_01735 [Capsaspora owczarzaki ATCC 30864]|uniref:Uncharacterized protein n=1 Tax=Capsaspora owczarzaki (strain ATCC 30864) TaxID=595528 RepID=A0A0D2U5J6_CAPO3|nr:hypothetical protein CAOG_01735 [Capsaspora owczarzaki ATCC 30864]KJE90421.1 hypothetical protein CAOG_001735 [Capsaspora owczarzaki ATCC 30864]|eukprot:XP_004364603.1 hypothetical protein CAOG_01735 [Capsaspora owczarzaki ATCC 30864]